MDESPAPGQDPGHPYPASYFRRQDETEDGHFYYSPRKVVHIDEGAIAALGMVYADLLPRSGTLLDLMSAWRTHLPAELANLAELEVVGLGMNDEELADNPQLTRWLVHDLNARPRLPFEDSEFDGATCAVSVQYMRRPLEIFAEVARVLKPGAVFVLSFSNRCFPTKAVAIWHQTTDEQHVQLVGSYFRQAGGWDEPQGRIWQPVDGDPLYVVWARRS
jgi:SAM-dependent methyltransferase